jgi:hypothetical protein
MDPKLLTEIERQEAVLAELSEDYEFPLFDGRQAIESQRKSGYKNTARAAREIVDNAYEAGARNVWAVFKRPTEEERGKHERRDAISAVAFIDDPCHLSCLGRSPGKLKKKRPRGVDKSLNVDCYINALVE